LVSRPAGHGFRRSSFSSAGAGVEAAPQPDGSVVLRDSKNVNGPQHVFSRQEWTEFVRGVKAGEFDFGAAQPAGVDSATIRLTL
jgi:hypothetical protein